jgi:hypothetical protein
MVLCSMCGLGSRPSPCTLLLYIRLLTDFTDHEITEGLRDPNLKVSWVHHFSEDKINACATI